jgi:hypothetical protein
MSAPKRCSGGSIRGRRVRACSPDERSEIGTDLCAWQRRPRVSLRSPGLRGGSISSRAPMRCRSWRRREREGRFPVYQGKYQGI